MKQIYYYVIFLFSVFSFGQNFSDTKGELQISSSGTAVYTLPIAVPPSIKNVAPIINLVYSSGVRGGIAGQGWSINSISAISRIGTRRDIDGFVDGVDFDDNDKLALDGQRLLIKSGTYWAPGSTYETEYKSNTRIELKVEGTTAYFVVTAPDGSRSWYGSKGSGSLQNSVSLNSWYIVHYEDPNGNFIDYNYKTITYNSTNQLYIDTIIFSGNAAAGIAAQNKIAFTYRGAKRIERDYLKGQAVYASQILESIQVYANNALFRNYQVQHEADNGLGYERIKSIQEINGQMEASNPVVFTYASSPFKQERTEKVYTNNLAFDKTDLAGDFDGDGRLDFIASNQIYTNLFNGTAGNAPVALPFITTDGKILAATTLTNNKLNQFQSVVRISESLNNLVFNVYNLNTGTAVNSYNRSIPFDNKITNEQNPGCTNMNQVPYDLKNDNIYLEGDFNGDGISDVFVITNKNQQVVVKNIVGDEDPKHKGRCTYETIDEGLEYYFIDLNPNSSNVLGTPAYARIQTTSEIRVRNQWNKQFVMDFNGDGKSDILTLKNDKTYKVFSLKQLAVAPWVQLEIIGEGVMPDCDFRKQIIFGDYNGDGKADLMLPDNLGGQGQIKWHIYYSNPNPAGGEFFIKESHDIVEYWPDTESTYNTQRHFSNYYAIDINKDGKSDLVRVWRKYFKDSWTINNHDTEWQVTGFTNNIGKVGTTGFTIGYDSGVIFSNSPDIPIPITSNYKYDGANTDLVVIRGHYNKIEYYQFNKNVDTENRLTEVTEASGNIKQKIEYRAMEAANSGLGIASTDFYSSSDNVAYPNIEILRNSESFLVSKLTATINGVSKYQDFRYRGFVSNFNYGTVGFTRTARSSWYLSESDPKIWTTQYNDPNLRGANTITWTSTTGSTVFDNVPSNLITTKTNVFAVNTKGGGDMVSSTPIPNNIDIVTPVTTGQTFKAGSLITASSSINDGLAVNYNAPQIILKPGFIASASSNNTFVASTSPASAPNAGAPDSNNGVFNVLLNKQIVQDHLTGVRRETIYSYDGGADSGNYYGLEVRSVTNSYSGSSLQGSTAVDTEYDNNPTGAGASYYIGRPKRVVSTARNTASGDTRTSEQAYTYSGSNLTKTEKKGHNTYAIVEDMSYDALGNLLTKTVSAPTASPAPAPRTIKDEYDSTKRFVVKKTDHQGFVTNFAYNNLGQVTQSTDYMGIISDFVYDGWGKLTNSTVTGSSAIPITTTNVYAKLSSGGYTVTTTNSLDAKTFTEYDVLGRVVKNSTKGFAINSMVTKQVVYDALGRKEKESEPYFSAPSLWTVYEYDFLMRPTKITSPTGKIQTFSYEGMTTISSDDGKKTTASVDALGNKIQTTDPGGTINFTYFANGQLKESDYQGNKVQIVIDGWGNKVKLTDPSAGVYTYSYDAFGQLLTESTPNGTTSFVYDAAGKPTEKTISGTNTNSKTTYAYNSLNQITGSTFVDNTESKTIANVYEYDSLKRLYKTTETTPYAVFAKELSFDTQGRILKETSTASASGKTSSKTIKNIYYNGFPWQIVDDATQQVLWQPNSFNERGQVTVGAFGNGISVTNTYDQYGYVRQIRHDKTSPSVINIMTLNTDFEIKRGNLNSRTNSLFGRSETFNYDGLDRLTEYTNGAGIQETQVYDDKGRITQNSVGIYEYDGAKTYQNKAIVSTTEALGYYSAKPNLTISYNTFKSPVQIEEAGVDKISFTYNDGNDRSSMFYGNLDNNKLLRTYRKHYSADGTMEVKHNIATGEIEFVTYIGGDGYSAPIVLKSNGTAQNYLYLHRDYQGSIVAISDQNGTVVEKRLFDAWGSILKVQDGVGNTLAGLTVLDRGYTGHEHLQSVGIIHMNGRLYDPKLHRFLQPDNYVQEPYNTQNYNKYAYVLNNPLKYTDPSGEFAEIGVLAAVGIGAAIAALTYTITALVADVPFTVGGLVKATFIGAASSAVTFGIGSAATNLFTNFYSQAAFQAAAHGTFQGSMTAISGGKFWSGFAAGALSSIASSAWSGGSSAPETHSFGGASFTETFNHQGISGFLGANNTVGMIAFGTVSGGAGAAMSGGNFWQGAVAGLVVSGLNHAVHPIDPPVKKGLTSGGEYYGGDGSGSFMDHLHRFVYETDQLNPIALGWDGIKAKFTGTDRYGNSLSGFQSSLKICSAVPVGRFMGPSESLLGHIFRDAAGHVNPTSMASKMRYMRLFESVATKPENLVPTVNASARAAGVLTYEQTFRNGSTVWVQMFRGQIRNAGINLQ
ncbi:RHS repeat-associated core domain-containing protein [Flavobacterium sp. CFBP9031]|uniref:RHS repeat-associated core domain-containing protein n=1 Tax=Flavobacterium sp. CFBP9031 TaxID=3096538 RepID=UPI002A699625|nr:RHS repeat-associated core domain-containing protein [Flavobacterium sp. CFBP9031]MDY0989668.1 RHS repeat-associated core domain-containing protein [Flavobacterium sp. CFBP9031]